LKPRFPPVESKQVGTRSKVIDRAPRNRRLSSN